MWCGEIQNSINAFVHGLNLTTIYLKCIVYVYAVYCITMASWEDFSMPQHHFVHFHSSSILISSPTMIVKSKLLGMQNTLHRCRKGMHLNIEFEVIYKIIRNCFVSIFCFSKTWILLINVLQDISHMMPILRWQSYNFINKAIEQRIIGYITMSRRKT